MYQVEYLYVISVPLKQIASIPQNFALGVKHNIGCICLHYIGLGVEAGFARAAVHYAQGIPTAAEIVFYALNKHVKVAPVLPAVQPNTDILGKDKVLAAVLFGVLFAYSPCVAPFGAAVFFAPAAVAACGEIYSNACAVSCKEYKNGLWRVGAPLYTDGAVHAVGKAFHNARKPIG